MLIIIQICLQHVILMLNIFLCFNYFFHYFIHEKLVSTFTILIVVEVFANLTFANVKELLHERNYLNNIQARFNQS